MRGFSFVLLFFFGVIFVASGQSIDQLKAEIKQAEEEIRMTNQLISKTRDKQKDGANQLKLVQSKINNRKKILANLDKQITIIQRGIAGNNKTVKLLDKDLELLRREYAATMRDGYKNYKLNNYMLFLFSATDFNDMARRMYYIKRYSQMRENKASQIESKWNNLERETKTLKEKQAELDATVADKNKEIKSLASEQMQQQKLINQLKSEEKTLNKSLQSKQSAIAQLEKRIRQIIEEEARKLKGEKRTESQEQDLIILSGKFDQNKGKLPYPVRGGVVVDRFGVHPHPTTKGAMINNKGINITAENRSEIYAVFEGEVSKVFFFQGLNNSVIIRHGNYMTVYSNLSEVNVKSGDKVSINQKIGRMIADDSSENCVLHFEIWQETKNMNPEEWLKR